MSSSDERDERDEEELSLTSPEVLNKYKKAADIVNKALQVVLAECKPDAKIVDICEKGDAYIKEQTANMYKNAKKKIEKGVAFPTCISVNNTVGHFSPLASDESVLADGDMVKIDMGCHIDGFIALVGHTHVLQEGLVSGRKSDVIRAANTAAEVALRLVRPGKKNTDVTEAIQKVAAAYDCKIVEGVLSHQMKQHVIEGNKVVLSVSSPETTVDEVEFEENEVYAIDIVASTGDGKPKLLDETQTTIYKKGESDENQLKMKASRSIISEIKNFPRMPFTARVLSMSLEEKTTRLGVVDCVKHGHLQPYPVLYENPGDFVAQIKFTVLLMPNGSDRITSHTLQELETKISEDPEIQGWLALGGKKKKGGGKKKKAKKAGKEGEASTEAEPMLVIKLRQSSKFISLAYGHEGVESYVLKVGGYSQDPEKSNLQIEPEAAKDDTQAKQLFSLLMEDDVLEGVQSMSSVVYAAQLFLSSLLGIKLKKSILPPPPSRYRDDYREIRRLGQGGFGEVILCENLVDKHEYAVKRIRVEEVEELPLMMREVNTLARLKHPYVIRYYTGWVEKGYYPSGVSSPTSSMASNSMHSHSVVGSPAKKVPDSEAQTLYIQLELCACTLRDLLVRQDYDAEEIFAWRAMYQIAQGIQQVHEYMIVHRDINPSNIFVDGHENMKIADFGLAKFREDVKAVKKADYGSHPLPGTSCYIAPEVSKSSDIDEKVDIFSFGIVCLEIWIPFRSAMERAKTIHDFKESNLPSEWEDNHVLLAGLLRRMTATNPAHRPSAAEIVKEIEILAGIH